MTALGVGTLAFNNMTGLGQGGTGTLSVDGTVVATQKLEHTMPMILQWDESFDIGSDTLTGVNDADYKPPFCFTGGIAVNAVAGTSVPSSSRNSRQAASRPSSPAPVSPFGMWT